MRKRRRLIQFILISFISAGAELRAESAAPIKTLEKRNLALQLSENKSQVIQADSEKHKILVSLYTINQTMQKVNREKSRLVDQRLQVDSRAQQIAHSIQQVDLQIRQKKILLSQRLRRMYELSGQSYLAILFSQNSLSDVDRTLKFLRIISEKDFELLTDYKKSLADKRSQKTQLQNQVAQLLKIEKQIKSQENFLNQEQEAKSKIVATLETSKQIHLNEMKDLRLQATSVSKRTPSSASVDDAELASLLRPSFFEKKGELPPPSLGPVTQKFGLIQDPRSKVQLSHKGWFYSVRPGTPLTSVFSGEIIFNDWIAGYGQTLVVDHGDHYYTVYAHTNHPKVALGDHVETQQIIAEAAKSERPQDEGFYFEVRHFSEPEDPAQWLSLHHEERK